MCCWAAAATAAAQPMQQQRGGPAHMNGELHWSCSSHCRQLLSLEGHSLQHWISLLLLFRRCSIPVFYASWTQSQQFCAKRLYL
jgi:hypothetical protein